MSHVKAFCSEVNAPRDGKMVVCPLYKWIGGGREQGGYRGFRGGRWYLAEWMRRALNPGVACVGLEALLEVCNIIVTIESAGHVGDPVHSKQRRFFADTFTSLQDAS